MKVAAGTRWLPGQLHEPVVVRRVHEANRTTGCAVVGRAWPQSGVRHWRARMQIYLEVLKWLRTQRNQQMRIRLIPEAMRRETQNLVSHADGRTRRLGLTACCFLILLSQSPSLLRYPSFARAFLRDAYHCLRG